MTSWKVMATMASQLSEALAFPNAVLMAGSVLAVQAIVMFAGQKVITGGRLSSMVINWLHVLELPQSSVAVQVRVMVYSWGHMPPAVTSANVIVGVPSQLSVAVAVPVLAGAVLAVHWIVMLGGQVMAGARLSSMVIDWTHVLKLPQSSWARQVRVIVYS